MLQNTHTEYIKLHFFKLHFCDKKKHGRSTGVFICICFHAFLFKTCSLYIFTISLRAANAEAAVVINFLSIIFHPVLYMCTYRKYALLVLMACLISDINVRLACSLLLITIIITEQASM